MKPPRKQSLTLSFWNIPTSDKKASKKRRSSVPVVHFSDQVRHLDSDGESMSSSLPSNSSEPNLTDLHDDFKIRPPSDGALPDHQDEDPEEQESLRHLDRLGQTLENTFKEVESIDAYVHKLRCRFDHDLLSEHRFMSCICSAKLARAACCKRQIKAWKDLQHEMQDFCCHHHLHHHNHGEVNEHSNDCENNHEEDASSNTSHDEEIGDLIHQLSKLSTFKSIKDRLDPKGDAKSFVEHWILQNEHFHGVHCSDEN